MNKIISYVTSLTFRTALICTAVSSTSFAQETIKLIVGGVVSDSHYMTVNGLKPWMDKVTELTNGRVQFEYYPAQQLGKANTIISLAQSGVVDIGEQPVAYVSEKLPLSGIVELPGLVSSACKGTAAYRKLAQTGGLLAKNDFEPNGVHVVMSVVYAPYKLLNATRDVRSLNSHSQGEALAGRWNDERRSAADAGDCQEPHVTPEAAHA